MRVWLRVSSSASLNEPNGDTRVDASEPNDAARRDGTSSTGDDATSSTGDDATIPTGDDATIGAMNDASTISPGDHSAAALAGRLGKTAFLIGLGPHESPYPTMGQLDINGPRRRT